MDSLRLPYRLGNVGLASGSRFSKISGLAYQSIIRCRSGKSTHISMISNSVTHLQTAELHQHRNRRKLRASANVSASNDVRAIADVTAPNADLSTSSADVSASNVCSMMFHDALRVFHDVLLVVHFVLRCITMFYMCFHDV